MQEHSLVISLSDGKGMIGTSIISFRVFPR